MANDAMRAALNRMLTNYSLERNKLFGRIQDCRAALGEAETNHRRAMETERRAILADDEQTRAMQELMEYYNSMPEPRPPDLLEQYTEMSQAQLETYRQRLTAGDTAVRAYYTLEERRREVAAAEQELNAVDARIEETNLNIQRLNRA